MFKTRGTREWELQIADRQIVGTGLKREFWRDVFHYCMTISWPRLIGCYLFYLLVVNTIFCLLYWAVDGAITGARTPTFFDLFFFSFHVFGTASFGAFIAGSYYGETIVTIEIIIGIASYAVMTGLAFARFTRPQAQILFTRHPIIALYEGRLTLMIRVANTRHNFMSDAFAKMWLIASDRAPDGSTTLTRRFHRLKLEREDNPVFALSWTLYHVIDEQSPLAGEDAEGLAERDSQIAMIVTGHDEDYSQDVRSRFLYVSRDIRWHHAYVDIFTRTDSGVVKVDYSRFHDTESLGKTSVV